jgi:hypothetical protein
MQWQRSKKPCLHSVVAEKERARVEAKRREESGVYIQFGILLSAIQCRLLALNGHYDVVQLI